MHTSDCCVGAAPDRPRTVLRGVRPRAYALHGLPATFRCRRPAGTTLLVVAKARGITVLENAAHGIGTTLHGRPAGVLANGASFSLYATTNITCGEGGMVTIDREDIARRMRIERLHEIDVDASQRDGAAYTHWESVSIGWKYNLSDLAAAIGLVQLEKLPRFLGRRRALDACYREGLREIPVFEPVTGPPGAGNGAHLFPILIRSGALRIDRDAVLRALLAEGIGSFERDGTP